MFLRKEDGDDEKGDRGVPAAYYAAWHDFHVHRVRSYRGVRGMPPERKPDEVQIRGRLCGMAL